MNAVEDRLRALMQAAAVIVPDGSAPPLIPPGEEAGPAARRRNPRRNVTWIAPLTAAAAVIALVAGLLAVHGNSGGHQAPTGFAAPAARLPDGLPAYILAAPNRTAPASDVTFQYRPSAVGRETIDIIATATGRTAQTATLPGLVVYVTADHQGRFYAAVLMRSGPVRLYEIRRRAGGTVAAVTVLPIRATRAMVGSLAVSPNGSWLAMTTYRANDRGDPGTPRTASLVVASTASGAERRWTPARIAEHGTVDAMTWLADNRTLALAWWPTDGKPAIGASLRLLDTAAPGTSLLAGRAVLQLISPAGKFPALAVSQTGRVLVGATFYYPGGVVQGQRVPTGSLIRFIEPGGRASFLYRPPDQGHVLPGACQPPAWISPSGRQVLALCFRATKRAPMHLVLLSEGRATVLPQLARLAQRLDLIALGG